MFHVNSPRSRQNTMLAPKGKCCCNATIDLTENAAFAIMIVTSPGTTPKGVFVCRLPLGLDSEGHEGEYWFGLGRITHGHWYPTYYLLGRYLK